MPLRKILKAGAVPTLKLGPDEVNPRKRQAAENRLASASKRARKEMVAAQKEIVDGLLRDHSTKMKDAGVQADSQGN